MKNNMNYLPLGKNGCINCHGLDYYCDDCTAKITKAANDATAQQTRAADVCQHCGGDGVCVAGCCWDDICEICGTRR